MKLVPLLLVVGLSVAQPAAAQDPPCRLICSPKFKVEPTLTVTNLFGRPRVISDDGVTMRERRQREFELILSMDLPTRVEWLGFTVEAILLPFERDSTPELEFEANFTWLPSKRTRGWVSSHVDIVDKFSAAERPGDRGRYTHKLNIELDTSVAIFKRLAPGRWLRGVELEGSLDYVATGLSKAGDLIDGVRYLDRSSPWSFSIVFVLPIAPM